jgi:hypothetical protein
MIIKREQCKVDSITTKYDGEEYTYTEWTFDNNTVDWEVTDEYGTVVHDDRIINFMADEYEETL